MVTVDGRLVHVDFGYALGKEPLDSVLIHFAVQGFQPDWVVEIMYCDMLYKTTVIFVGK